MLSGRGNAAHNMATDEALLDAMPRWQKPILRLYSWIEPAASFGYFQKYSDIEHATLLRPLVRRPTGGGLVPHDADWTYSVAFPTVHEWHGISAVESYQRVHEWIQAAFAELNVATELAPCCKKSERGQCFVGYEKFDVLWHGKKIAGAAQRQFGNLTLWKENSRVMWTGTFFEQLGQDLRCALRVMTANRLIVPIKWRCISRGSPPHVV